MHEAYWMHVTAGICPHTSSCRINLDCVCMHTHTHVYVHVCAVTKVMTIRSMTGVLIEVIVRWGLFDASPVVLHKKLYTA